MVGNLVQNQFTTARDLAVRIGHFAAADRSGSCTYSGRVGQTGTGTALKRLLSVYAAGAYAFLYLPLLVLSLFSFNASRFSVWQGFSWHWYSQVFEMNN